MAVLGGDGGGVGVVVLHRQSGQVQGLGEAGRMEIGVEVMGHAQGSYAHFGHQRRHRGLEGGDRLGRAKVAMDWRNQGLVAPNDTDCVLEKRAQCQNRRHLSRQTDDVAHCRADAARRRPSPIQASQLSMPSPLLAESCNTTMSGLTRRALAMHASTSKST